MGCKESKVKVRQGMERQGRARQYMGRKGKVKKGM